MALCPWCRILNFGSRKHRGDSPSKPRAEVRQFTFCPNLVPTCSDRTPEGRPICPSARYNANGCKKRATCHSPTFSAGAPCERPGTANFESTLKARFKPTCSQTESAKARQENKQQSPRVNKPTALLLEGPGPFLQVVLVPIRQPLSRKYSQFMRIVSPRRKPAFRYRTQAALRKQSSLQGPRIPHELQGMKTCTVRLSVHARQDHLKQVQGSNQAPRPVGILSRQPKTSEDLTPRFFDRLMHVA